MTSSSSTRTCIYDVFPSFSGEDVRKSFLSHLLREFRSKAVNIFIDNDVDRSRSISRELVCAIRESRISIVILSKNYASSTWCLNELVEIHKCYEELDQMVIPVFYGVDPSHVRKQGKEFGKVFGETCMGRRENEKGRWIRALTEVANLAGEDSRNWRDEAEMIEKIANDVLNKLITPSKKYGDFVGLEAHIDKLISMLRFESEKPRMIGILGPKGIGKSTIGRVLYGRLMSKFRHCAFVQYRRTEENDYDMMLIWEERFLSDILRQKDIKIYEIGMVEQRLKHKKVLIVLDDVDDAMLLNTLVGEKSWFGSKSKIVVISSDRKILKGHNIKDVYEVDFPSEELALQMFCRVAFARKSPPRGFSKLADETAKRVGNLPRDLKWWGYFFKGMDKEKWVKSLSDLPNGSDGKIMKEQVKIIYDGFDQKDQTHRIARLTNGPTSGQCSNSQPRRNMDPIRMRDFTSGSQAKVEWIHLLQGVSMIVSILSDGTKFLKHLSYNGEEPQMEQAKKWWLENMQKVCEKYDITNIEQSIDGGDNFDKINIVRDAGFDDKYQALKPGQSSTPQPQIHKNATNRMRTKLEVDTLLNLRGLTIDPMKGKSTDPKPQQRNMDAGGLGRDKLVHERIGTSNGLCFDFKSPTSVVSASQVGETKIECESGLFITLGILGNGARFLNRVEFSPRFGQEAKMWWSKNWMKVYEKYNISGVDTSIDGMVHFNVDPNPNRGQPQPQTTHNFGAFKPQFYRF